jgi:hypothetical protein
MNSSRERWVLVLPRSRCHCQGGTRLLEQAFGVGCFHFGLRKSAPTNYTVRKFTEEVEKAIGSVPNVDGVEVSCDPEAYDQEIPQLDVDPPHLEADGPYPYLPHGHVSLDLLIPSRVQNQLLVRPGIPTSTERFEVDINYQFHMPVANVRPVDPLSEPDPSDSVIIVRKLLEREFGQQRSNIDFQSLGPSPIHADFYMQATDESRLPGAWAFDVEIEHIRGYDRYDFYFNQSIFSDAEEALQMLWHELDTELDLFYAVTQLESRRMDAWYEIDNLTSALVELHRKRGLSAFLERTFKGSRLLNDTFVSLAEFEGNEILQANSLRDSYRHTYSADTVPHLREMVDRNLEERATYPTEQTRSLLQLFETRRLSAAELRVVVISAISGGAFGALATAMLGNP